MAATNYVTGAMGLTGFAFLIQAMSSAAPVTPAAHLPSVGWLKEIRAPAPVSSPMPSAVAAPVPGPRVKEHAPEPTKAAPATREKTGHAIAARDHASSEPQVLPPKPAKAEPARRAAPAAVPADEPEAPKSEPPKPSRPAAAPAAAQSGDEPEEQGIGTLAVTSNPPGAALFLDGANVGQTPIEIDVPAGIHKLRTISPIDGTDRRQTATVKANGTTKVEVAF